MSDARTTRFAQWDAPTAVELHASGGLKWSDGPDVLGAWVAESDFGTAPEVIAALAQATERASFGYATPALTERLSAATAGWYERRYGWSPRAETIRPLGDVVDALVQTLRHFARPGVPVVVPTPAYMPFLSVPLAIGNPVRRVPLRPDEWGIVRLDLDAIEDQLRAGAGVVVLTNPGNPFGRVFERAELTALADLAARYGARVFSDEIHAPITLYGAQHIPFASVSETASRVAVTAASASKAWNLAGLKTAQLLLTNADDVERWAAVGAFAEHGASTPGMRANIAAYEAAEPWLGDVIAYLERNDAVLRSTVAELLPDARVSLLQGSYLAWIDLRAYGVPDEPSPWLLDVARVHVNGGTEFGEAGRGCVRFNIALPTPLLVDAIGRIARAVLS